MLTLCDARLAYIYTYLSAILCMNKLSKTASVIYIHFQSILEFICREISQIQTIQFLCKRALWHFRHKQGLRLLLKFFKKILPAQITAFTTSSSVGSIPASIECQRKSVGIDEEISNFTTSLGTTIGMPGCTCVWPILLAIFYTNAMGIAWTVSDYVMLAVVCLILSLGSAGVPGIGVVSAMAVFKAVNLPIAAIVLLVPINNISDMIRTLDNVTAGNVTAAIVARKMGTLDDNIFNAEEKKGENA